jgi:glycosyltransferase involved in cell wall biosynthesis
MSAAGPPLHIVHGVHSLDVGGLERIVVDLIRMGRRAGHRISVICLERPGTLGTTAEAQGATVISLGKPPGRTPEIIRSASARLAELRPHILHTHTIGALWYLGPAARSVGRIAVLHTEHIDNVGKAEGWRSKIKTRLLWNRAGRYSDRFCCVSDDIARSARRWCTIPRSKLDTVLNGIETEKYTDRTERSAIRQEMGIPEGARVVGTVGRLNEVKRQDLLLRSVATPGAGLDDVRVLIVGDGPEREALQKLAHNLGIAERVHFAGYQPAPERYLAAMDVFALTSRLEGLPLAMLEAWAAGLPVVASAVGGVPKVVMHGVSGLLFPNGDLAALTASLKRFFADPEEAARMAVAGTVTVRERFSLQRMASEYEARYRQLCLTIPGD